jgi:hypothetical protein
MSSVFRQEIEAANKRGVGGFHVFCDQELYAGGDWVGENRYSTTWRTLETAKVVARKEKNGRVYDLSGSLVK